jgi:hypothetical protein
LYWAVLYNCILVVRVVDGTTLLPHNLMFHNCHRIRRRRCFFIWHLSLFGTFLYLVPFFIWHLSLFVAFLCKRRVSAAG